MFWDVFTTAETLVEGAGHDVTTFPIEDGLVDARHYFRTHGCEFVANFLVSESFLGFDNGL